MAVGREKRGEEEKREGRVEGGSRGRGTSEREGVTREGSQPMSEEKVGQRGMR